MFSALEEILRNGRFGVLLRHLIGKPGSLRAHLVKHTTGVFALKITSTLLAFVSSVILARLLGAAGYGLYAYVWSVITFLSIPATFGLSQLLVRNIASYQTKEEWGHIKGLLHFADKTVLAASLVLGVLLGLGVWLLSDHVGTQTMYTFFIALPLLLFMALLQMRQMALQGLNRIVQGEILPSLVRPTLFILLIGAVYSLQGHISPPSAMGMQVVAFVIAFVVGMILLNKYLSQHVSEFPPRFEIKPWMRSALPLLGSEVFSMVHQYTPILLLGPLKGAEAVGVYKVAFQMSTLISFTLMAVATTISPTISSLYAKSKKKELEQVISNATLWASLPAFMLTFIFIAMGAPVLASIFGEEFSEGATALAILSLGNLVSTAVGPVGWVLNMTGNERVVTWVLGVSSVVIVVLSAIFIPIWGVKGAAAAVTVGTVACRVLLTVKVMEKVGVNPTVLGKISLKHKEAKVS